MIKLKELTIQQVEKRNSHSPCFEVQSAQNVMKCHSTSVNTPRDKLEDQSSGLQHLQQKLNLIICVYNPNTQSIRDGQIGVWGCCKQIGANLIEVVSSESSERPIPPNKGKTIGEDT